MPDRLIISLMEGRPQFAIRAGSRELVSLLPAIARGDRQAFAALYQRTSAKMFGIARRLLGDDGAAEEVLQDVFLTIWNKAGQFEPSRASPITWMAVMTRNRAIDRKRRAVLPTTSVEAANDVAADIPLADAVIEQSQSSHQLADCLKELDEQANRYIRAAFFDGATYGELATRDNVPLGTMKSWIRRGLLSLRECLER